jgi:hypothetical protein
VSVAEYAMQTQNQLPDEGDGVDIEALAAAR